VTASQTLPNGWSVVEFLLYRALPAVVLFAIILLLGKLVRRLADRWLVRRRIPAEVRLLASRSLYLGALGLALFALAAAILADANTAVWGVIGAALLAGLGLQDLFKNYVSGFYLLLERKVRVGDMVETNGYKGVVTDVKMRVTYLRDDERLIIVPNSELFGRAAAVSAPKGEPSAAERPDEPEAPAPSEGERPAPTT
jgi:small-conductance mechanosensitive channel